MTKIAQSPALLRVPPRHPKSSPLGDPVAQEPSPERRLRRRLRLTDAAPFLAVAVQFYLLVALVVQFQLESQTFSRLMHLAFAGFLIHHLLPLRVRLPFFALLSVVSTAAVIEGTAALSPTGPGVMLIAIGLALIGVCHLPIPIPARIGLLGATGGVLAVIRGNSQWFPALEAMWAVLASMFIFRLMVYLYDLKNRKAEFGLARAVAYFFMLPNACFPLFPIIDYQTFCATHYNDDAIRIYQTGIRWMFRGVIHLLLYRLIYHYGLLNIAEVRDAGDVAQFMVATYLLYLRVSGQFHIIVGLLHMFGFNLPETHHLYLLASSFTDFWRRINIYWKDFIMKLFFYPASFALRRVGTVRAIAGATLAAFFATWLLHSWQWFWFRGHFLWTWQDTSFWSILAVLVLVNALYEAVYGRRRALTTAAVGPRARVVIGLKTIGTFLVICTLWTLWSAQSAGELRVLAESATKASWDDALIILAGLTVIGVSGALWGHAARNSSLALARNGAIRPQTPHHFWRSAGTVCAGAACALGLTAIEFPKGSRPDVLLSAARQDQMNAADLDLQRRGYYEELDVVRANQSLWARVKSAPPGWTNTGRIFRSRPDFIHCEMVPATTAMLSGAPATVNRWGMRDRDYAKEKPAQTLRTVLLGSSHEVGSGVKDDETFENIVEDRINRDWLGAGAGRFETLNLSVGGLSLFEKLYLLEESGFDFAPDIVIFSACAVDRGFVLEHLGRVVVENRPVPYNFLTDLFKRANVDGKLPREVIQHRLEPFVPEMYRWIFARLKNQCAERGITALVLYRPAPNLAERRDPTRREELISGASSLGLEVLDLSAAFNRVEDQTALRLAAWDGHTNVTGHRLLAEELFKQLEPRLSRPPIEGSKARR